MSKRRAWDIISKFIYDSSRMDNDRKFKAQEAANLLYDDDEYKALRGYTIMIRQSPKTLRLETRLKSNSKKLF